MLSLAFSCGMLGIEAYVVRVEADSSPGTPAFSIIGLPDRALSESRDRVRSAIFNSGFAYPPGRLLVNLSPADVRKEGPSFDLSIALALLGMDEQIPREALRTFIALDELALDGTLRPVNGILPMVLGARATGRTRLIVPQRNADEAALADGIELYAVDSLQSAVAVVLGNGGVYRRRVQRPNLSTSDDTTHGDLCDVRGQLAPKRALEIAAAGGHNLLFVGPPGCGKTLGVRRSSGGAARPRADEVLELHRRGRPGRERGRTRAREQ